MALSRLPVEILEAILLSHSLSPLDWQSIRLVSKGLSEIVTARLFSSLTAWLDKTCLERLVSISKHEQLRKHVVRLEIQITESFGDPFHGRFRSDDDDGDEAEKFHLQDNFFQKLMLQHDVSESYVQLTFENMGQILRKPEWGRKELEAAFTSYWTFVKQQYDLMYTGMAQAYLAIALSNFPTLRHGKLEALIRHHPLDCPSTMPLPAWGICAMEEKILVRVNVQGSAYRSRHLEKILCAIACSGLSLKTLEMDDSGWQFLTHQFLDMARRAWRSVECLTVILSDDRYIPQSQSMKRLGQVLMTMENLTQLTIRQSQEAQGTGDSVDISPILDGDHPIILKCLRHLKLNSFEFTNEALSSFLNRHHSLSQLHLYNVKTMGAGGMWTLINSIRHSRRLNEFQLDGLLYECHPDCEFADCIVVFEDMAAVHRFAMGQTDDLPKLHIFDCECGVGYPPEVLPNAASAS